MPKNNYDSCWIKSKGSCGAYTKPGRPIADLYFVNDKNLSVKDHIKSLSSHTNNNL